MATSAQPAVVFVDADNTLWDTDAVFADAQLAMLAAVEKRLGLVASTDDRLAFVRSIDQGIAERHHARLRYPPRLLAKAVSLALEGLASERAAQLAVNSTDPGQALSDEDALRFESAFFDHLAELPPLRPGVREGLTALHDAGATVFVITEGGRDRIERTARGHHLSELIERVLDGPKETQMYARALRIARKSDGAFMIGDQLDRDIAPAKAAGLRTIYFPGGFRPRWGLEESSVLPEFRIDRFDAVPAIVMGGAVSTVE